MCLYQYNVIFVEKNWRNNLNNTEQVLLYLNKNELK